MLGAVDTAAGPVPAVGTRWTAADLLGAWGVRWGVRRDRYRVDPGLYAVGSPTPESPVLATANYKYTFDVVRRELARVDAWLLVLDTRGINVWCAAGKRRFSTDELVHRITTSGLEHVVDHRTVIVPQLGATGVAAHLVRPRCGFRARFGPVLASDIPAYLGAGMEASPQMRDVTFGTWDRAVLAPVELVTMARHGLWAAPALAVMSLIGPWMAGSLARVGWALPGVLATRGLAAALAYVVGAIAGTVATPVLLPWVPARSFWLKGALVGGIAGMLFGAAIVTTGLVNPPGALGLAFVIAAVSAWGAMNFTGTSTYTSPSGVEEEMRRGIPVQAVMLVAGLLLWVASAWVG